MRFPRPSSILPSALTLLTSACGAGTVAVLESSSGSSSTNTPPSVTGITLIDGHGPDAHLRLFVVDSQGDSALVRFWYQAPGGTPRPASNLVELSAGGSGSPGGVQSPGSGRFLWAPGVHDVTWMWSTEDDLPSNAALVHGVRIWALVQGGSEGVVNDVNALTVDLGNDAPQIAYVQVANREGGGNIPVTFAVLDSSRDLASVEFQYRIVGGTDLDWKPMHAPGAAVDNVLLCNVETTCTSSADCPATIENTFLWNTTADLPGREVDVEMRATPRDGPCDLLKALSTGLPHSMPMPLRVDNNQSPLVIIENGEFLAQSDARRVLQVPFRVIDAEGDPTGIVVQWRAPGETFPDLGVTSPGDLEERLQNESWRREKHICTEAARVFEGRVGPLPPGLDASRHVRVAELASSEAVALGLGPGSWDFEYELVGEHYAVLPWPASSEELIGALPLADGRDALVLSARGSGWALARRVLATGAFEGELLASGTGLPRALALDSAQRLAFLAIDVGSQARVIRVSTETGLTEHVYDLPGPDPIRSVCVTGEGLPVATAGSSLWGWTNGEAGPAACAILEGLDLPWGLASVPGSAGQVYLAEAGRRRILLVDTRGGTSTELPIGDPGPDGFEPRTLCVDLVRGQLLLCGPTATGLQQIRALESSQSTFDSQAMGDGPIVDIEFEFPGTDAAVGAAPASGTHVVITRSGAGPWVRRAWNVVHLAPDPGGTTLHAYDPSTQTLDLGSAVMPRPQPGSRWRLRSRGLRLRATPDGAERTFAWDTRDLGLTNRAYLRAFGVDSDLGISSAGSSPKAVASALDAPTERIGVEAQVNPSSVHVADMDADGDSDLIVAGALSHNVLVFYQDGRGAFRADADSQASNWIQFGPCFYPEHATPADLDGDGDQDVVVSCESGPGVSLWYQNPQRQFQFERWLGPTIGPPSPSIRQPAVADIDEDGRPDVVAPYHGLNKINVHRQGPAGFEETPSQELNGPLLTGPRSVELVDLDGDCLLDLVATTDSRLLLFYQLPTHAFEIQPVLPASPSLVPRSTTSLDMDGDGTPEIALLTGLPDPGIRIFTRTATRTYMTSQILTLPASSVQLEPRRMSAADIDADGDLDLVVAAGAYNANEGAVVVYEQIAPGVFAAGRAVGAEIDAQAPFDLTTGDVDGDGDVDVVWTSDRLTLGDTTAILRSDSPGDLGRGSSGQVDVSTPNLKTTTAISVADLDGDGDRDIVATGLQVPTPPYVSTTVVLFQTTPEHFEIASAPAGFVGTASSFPTALTPADMDGDGDLDLVVADFDANRVFIYEQGAPGRFGGTGHERILTTGIHGPFGLAVDDLDVDGHFDLAVANTSSQDIAIFRQQADGQFTHDPTVDHLVVPGDSPTPIAIASADFESDGDVDLVCSCFNTHRICVFRATARGAFGAPVLLGDASTTPAPRGLKCADVDGDGLLDVVVACAGTASGSRVVVFRGTKAGTFDPVPAFSLSDGARMLATVMVDTADIDMDGRLDILCANPSTQNATLFLQRANRRFDLPTRHMASLGNVVVSCLDVADLDGDGEQDVALGVNQGGNPRIEILYGGR